MIKYTYKCPICKIFFDDKNNKNNKDIILDDKIIHRYCDDCYKYLIWEKENYKN